MKNANEENRNIQEGVVEVNTLFDSDLAEYEFEQERAKEAKEKSE